MIMQMEAYLKKEQNGTPFLFGWGHWKGGWGGGGSLRGVHPKKYTCHKKNSLLICVFFFYC